MEFIAILVCLALEKWTGFGKALRSNNVLNEYISIASALFKKVHPHAFVGLIIFLIPILAIVEILYLILLHFLFGLLGFLFAVIILSFCLRSFDFNESDFVTALKFSNKSEEEAANIFLSSERNVFSVIFWFILLGPVGAVLYRLCDLLIHYDDPDVALMAQKFQQVLAWVPVRLQTLAFALISHFNAVIQFWLKHLFNGLAHNDEMLVECGFYAIEGKEPTSDLLAKENHSQIFQLIDRALVIWLVVMALVILI